MNRVKYKFHPSEYELGENEKFYSDMEAKGWRLLKRGGYFSKFTPVEPSQTRYRIEVSSPGFLEEAGLSDGQLAVFEDCGWEYVTSQGFLHIFRAPEGSDAPEFYTDPAQQAQTLKKIRRDLWFTLGIAIIMAIVVFLPLPFGIPSQFFREKFKRFIHSHHPLHHTVGRDAGPSLVIRQGAHRQIQQFRCAFLGQTRNFSGGLIDICAVILHGKNLLGVVCLT